MTVDIFDQIEKDLEKVFRKHFAKEYSKATAEAKKKLDEVRENNPTADSVVLEKEDYFYVQILPFKYRSWWYLFTSEQGFSQEGISKLKRVFNHLKAIKVLVESLPFLEGFLLELRTLKYAETKYEEACLGFYADTIHELTALTEGMIKRIHLPKGRKKNPYYKVIEELGRDYKLITGKEPKLSRDIEGNPTGKFYRLAYDVFEALGWTGKASIEDAIRAFPKKLSLPKIDMGYGKK